MPLAGLLLTCDTHLSPQVAALLRSPDMAKLPILTTPLDTFVTSVALAGVSRHVRADDTERMGQAIAHAAEHIDTTAMRAIIGHPGRLRMPPPAFRHRLVQTAHAANKRIVLPEGDEPRTVQAAVLCEQKGIAHCVLLGEADRIRHVAEVQGIALPNSLEIIEPAAVRTASSRRWSRCGAPRGSPRRRPSSNWKTTSCSAP